MGTAIADILPLALGVALSPLPIVAVILMLFARNARRTSLSFLLGWILGLAAVGTIVVFIANQAQEATGGESSPFAAIVRLLLALLFSFSPIATGRSAPSRGRNPRCLRG